MNFFEIQDKTWLSTGVSLSNYDEYKSDEEDEEEEILEEFLLSLEGFSLNMILKRPYSDSFELKHPDFEKIMIITLEPVGSADMYAVVVSKKED